MASLGLGLEGAFSLLKRGGANECGVLYAVFRPEGVRIAQEKSKGEKP